jgi:hypothetical protein
MMTTDGPGLTPDGPALQPDAGAAPDAPLAPDMALPADQAAPPADAAPLMPDSAPLMPDSAPLMPDSAPLMPDSAPPMPDAALAPAMFAIKPTVQDFGSVTVGVTSAALNFTVTNTGDLPSGPPTVSVSGDFVIVLSGCTNDVPGGTSCGVAVAFKPSAAGARSGTLVVTTSGGSTAVASLTGTGVAPTPAQFALKPLAFDFGWKQQGAATGDVIFTLTNTGGSASGVPTIAIGGADKADFAFNLGAPRTGFCPNPIPAGGSCTISLHFAPKTAMVSIMTQKVASLDISGTPGGTVSARLTGDATVAQGLQILPPSHDFGTQPVGQQTAPFTFTVTNTSTTSTVSQLAFALVAPGIYAVINPNPFLGDTNDCLVVKKGQLGPGQSCNIPFTFQPRAAGQVELMWQATGSIPGTVPITVQATAHLQGTGQ